MEATNTEQTTATGKRPLFSEETKQVFSCRPSFDLDFAERLLGRRRKKDITRATRERLTVQENSMRQLIRPGLIWDVFPVADADKGSVVLGNGKILASKKMVHALRESEGVIMFIATAGKQVDVKIDQLMAEGRLADAYVADALASAAVESLVDRFHADIAEKLGHHGQRVGLRFSPGYCDWPVTDQRQVFASLDHEAVGVELGDTFLMTPRKSVSGVFGIFSSSKNAPARIMDNPCQRCGKQDCIARRVDATPPVHSE